MAVAAVAGRTRRECLLGAALACTALAATAASVASGHYMRGVPVVGALVVLLAVFHARLLSWRSLISMTILVILFIPIRRYSLPASLPFNLEPYRIVVALVIVGWLMTVLINRGTRLRASGFERPLFAYMGVILLSLLANRSRVEAVGSFTVKAITFFLSYVLVFYFVVSVMRRVRDIDFFVRLLAAGGGVLGASAIFESATHINVFNHLSTVIPILHYGGSLAPETLRGGGLRVSASAQHPIALGAALAVLIPLAVYLARSTGASRWWLCGLLMLIGLFATRSRTGVTMLIAVAIVYIVLRPRETRRFWPALVPLVLAIHFAAPGAIGSIKQSFFPTGGILAQEKKNSVGSGRYATFGPVFHREVTPNPVLGEGYATRVIDPQGSGLNVPAAPITDDQWLGVLAETGFAGAIAFLWLFVRAARRMGKAARRDRSDRGWLLVATTASVVACPVGMLTYDSFAFVQVTFLMWLILAIGACALLTKPEEWKQSAPVRLRRGHGATMRQRLAYAPG